MKKIIYTRPDGGVSIVHPGSNDQREGETEDAFLDRVRRNSVPADATNIQTVNDLAIPADRSFRNAWKVNGASIEVDMPKAREIHKNRLRELRKPKFETLDVQFLRALEAADSAAQSSIAGKKQALRDVTIHPSITAALTPDALKTAVPEILK